MATPRLAMPYIVQSQAQKEVTHNGALNLLDIAVAAAVLDRDLGTPPASPSQGDCYLVAAMPTDAWAGRAGQIAAWIGTAWAFLAPPPGFAVHVLDEALSLLWNGTAWLGLGEVCGLGPALDAKLDDAQASAFGLGLLGAADGVAARGTLGLGALALKSALDLSGADATGTLATARLPALLAALAGLSTAADQLVYATGSNAFALTGLTALARSLLAGASASAMRTTLGAAASGANADITSTSALQTVNGALSVTGRVKSVGYPVRLDKPPPAAVIRSVYACHKQIAAKTRDRLSIVAAADNVTTPAGI